MGREKKMRKGRLPDACSHPRTPESNAIDWLKWVAIAAMFLDHAKYAGGLSVWLFYPGRFAYPIFAVLCGWNAARHTRSIANYAVRILYLGVIMEVIHYFAHIFFGIEESGRLNPVLTLGVGVLVCAALARNRLLGIIAIGAAYVPADLYFDYRFAGVFLVVLAYSKSAFSIPFVVLFAGLLNGLPWFWAISAFAGAFACIFLHCGCKWPCPLPNTRYLYLSFPLSFLPPVVIKLFQ